ncbi:MAG: putative metal-dependent hydrolase [Bacteroidota bacterium]|nr:putative metal-dependent hydrolase [Bacteroidota bacterium]
MTTTDDLRYPIGKFRATQSIEQVNIPEHIAIISQLPRKLREVTMALDDAQLDTPYRDGGWTIRQVVHHIADSHINSYCRFKLAMSEDNPSIKPYFEEKWAEFEDAKSAAVFYSLNLIEAVHGRWVLFLKSVTHDDFKRTFFHPEHQRSIPLFQAVELYSWHSEHHLAHITELKKRKNWELSGNDGV